MSLHLLIPLVVLVTPSCKGDFNIEVLMVIDSSMVDFHEVETVKLYLDTTIAGVQRIFRDPSVGARIDLSVKEIIYPDSEQPEGFQVERDAETTLENFCSWQESYTKLQNLSPDVSVLITRTNLCQRNNSTDSEVCNTLGLANKGQICSRSLSCAIAQDNGLVLPHTIAHEVGHVLGLPHDKKDGLTVMSAVLRESTSLPRWSKQSRQHISRLLKGDSTSCLKTELMTNKTRLRKSSLDLVRGRPGVTYSADLQCQLKLSTTNTSSCSNLSTCTRLWCNITGFCIPTSSPPAAGTLCGKHKWCVGGKCVQMEELDYLETMVVDGGWGSWSAWGPCSTTCSPSVRKAVRFCDAPVPQHGGSYCTGEAERFKLCPAERCPLINSRELRSRLCQQVLGSKTAACVSDPRKCRLTCRHDDLSSEITEVEGEDGLDCVVEDKPGVCIHQHCVKVGCDGQLDSDKVNDLCGLCDGDGTQCRRHQGFRSLTSESFPFAGYTRVTTIPPGGTLSINNIGSRENLLALQDGSGRRVLNWDRVVRQPGDYPLGDTTVNYIREDLGHWQNESIFIRTVKEEVDVYVLHRLHYSNLTWTFYTPINKSQTISSESTSSDSPLLESSSSDSPSLESTSSDSSSSESALSDSLRSLDSKPASIPSLSTRWTYSAWSPCSVTCGSGSRYSVPVCRAGSTLIVPDLFCDPTTKPRMKKDRCDKLPGCKPSWWTGPWQSCLHCIGLRKRTVLCIGENMKALPDQNCDHLERPEFSESCSNKTLCQSYGTDDSSTLPVYSLRDEKDESTTQISHRVPAAGVSTKPLGDTVAHRADLPVLTKHWINEQESAAAFHDAEDVLTVVQEPDSVEHEADYGALINAHIADDIHEDDLDVDDVVRYPVKVDEPAINDINGHKSEEPNADDLLLDGHRADDTHAKQLVHQGLEYDEVDSVPMNQHTAAQIAPSASNLVGEIGLSRLDFELTIDKLILGEWSNCSTPCGEGIMSREMSCVGSGCDPSMKMELWMGCNQGPCDRWITGEWSDCSTLCGSGKMVRRVSCPSVCDPTSRPPDQRNCTGGTCAAWWTSAWSGCSATCGPGFRQRLVECRDIENKGLSLSCSPRSKPIDRSPCRNTRCEADRNCLDSLTSSRCQRLKHLCGKQERFTRMCCRTCFLSIKSNHLKRRKV